ncbi:hypothetical protein KUCAC02_006517, partial [Chaenocephalus aceratus]
QSQTRAPTRRRAAGGLAAESGGAKGLTAAVQQETTHHHHSCTVCIGAAQCATSHRGHNSSKLDGLRPSWRAHSMQSFLSFTTPPSTLRVQVQGEPPVSHSRLEFQFRVVPDMMNRSSWMSVCVNKQSDRLQPIDSIIPAVSQTHAPPTR